MMPATTRRAMLERRRVAGAAGDRARRRAKPKSASIFPVAVGGPITKIIDGYAADFQRENPGIKVTPIYAGTYQDTLTKAQTALKAAIRTADGGAAVDRRVLPDRRRSDRAVRYAGKQTRRTRAGSAASIPRS